jgi:hypothetical protein
VLTVRTELTDRILFFGERHLRIVLAQFSALWVPETRLTSPNLLLRR